MDKNNFWVVVGVIAGLEVLFLGYTIYFVDSEVQLESKRVNAGLQNLDRLSRDKEIASEGDIEQVNQQRARVVENLLRSVVYLAMRDEMTLERRVLENQQPIDITKLVPKTKTAIEAIVNRIKANEAPYTGIKWPPAEMTGPQGAALTPIVWPALPADASAIAKFYRHWWVLRSVLDEVVAPLAAEVIQGVERSELERRRWRLLELRIDESPKNVPALVKGGYIAGYFGVQLALEMQLQHLATLVNRLSNTAFFAYPATVQVQMASMDPSEDIAIRQQPGETQIPQDIQLQVSAARPKVRVAIGLVIADLDLEVLLDMGRRHRATLGSRDQIEAFLKALDRDEFLRPYTATFEDGGAFDRAAFLNRMLDELMKDAR